jgi:hypothetical protein
LLHESWNQGLAWGKAVCLCSFWGWFLLNITQA